MPQENELIVREFLDSKAGEESGIVPAPTPGVSDFFFKPLLVRGGCDAHFAARLKRQD